MLWTIAVILFIAWLVLMLTGYVLGQFVHILLVIAIVIVIYRLVTGRRVV